MFDLLRKKTRSIGSVLFRGTIPMPFEQFASLQHSGLQLEPRASKSDDVYWSARVRHPVWGEADLDCFRSTPPPLRELLELDQRLSRADVDLIADCGSSICVTTRHERANVLRERKLALRIMNAVMGEDGVSVVDHGSQRFWSRAALEEELATDADLDIESIFTLHSVVPDGGGDVVWLHSHGLAELGYFDFDILKPAPAVGSSDIPRAFAYGIVEGKISATDAKITIAAPGGVVRMVAAETFQRSARPEDSALRDDPEGTHLASRYVVCEPAAGFLGRLLGRSIVPSRWLQEPIDDNTIIYFSNAATKLMAARARDTYAQFRRYASEFERFEVKPLVKLGLPVDGSSPADEDREHLWFEVTALADDHVTGTLLNEPWHIAGLQAGATYTYGVDKLSAWTIFTPAGSITPHEAAAVRMLREFGDAIFAELRPDRT